MIELPAAELHLKKKVHIAEQIRIYGQLLRVRWSPETA
jgi:hypothetical protein